MHHDAICTLLVLLFSWLSNDDGSRFLIRDQTTEKKASSIWRNIVDIVVKEGAKSLLQSVLKQLCCQTI